MHISDGSKGVSGCERRAREHVCGYGHFDEALIRGNKTWPRAGTRRPLVVPKLVVIGLKAAYDPLRGGAFHLVEPAVRVVDAQRDREAQALARALRAGVACVGLTEGHSLPASACDTPAGLRLCTAVPGESRLAAFARLCEEQNVRFREAAYIATCPADGAPLLEAGLALALADAGHNACVAADRVFPPRARGGLGQALVYVAAWAEGYPHRAIPSDGRG